MVEVKFGIRKHYILTSTDNEYLAGPAIIGWYSDYANLALKDGKFRPSTVTMRGTSVLDSLKIIKSLREDRLMRLEEAKSRVARDQLVGAVEEDSVAECEKKVRAVEKIYTVPFSGCRQKGWAIYFALSDLKSFCFDVSGEALPRSRFRAWSWADIESAASWMGEEIAKIDERVAARKRLLDEVDITPAGSAAGDVEQSRRV